MTKTFAPKTMTQTLRELKIGQRIKAEFTHESAPHAFARGAGIGIEQRVIRCGSKALNGIPAVKWLIELKRTK